MEGKYVREVIDRIVYVCVRGECAEQLVLNLIKLIRAQQHAEDTTPSHFLCTPLPSQTDESSSLPPSL